MSTGVRLGERFVDEEEPEVKGDGDDRGDPAVDELIEPLDAPAKEPGIIAVGACTVSGGSDRENEGRLL